MTAAVFSQTWQPPHTARPARRRPAGSVYWRRRALAALVVVATPAAIASVFLGGGPLTAAGDRRVAPEVVALDAQPVARQVYVVRTGDTLWSIARRIQPVGDVRPLVDALAGSRGGRPLQPGERVVAP